MIKSNSETNSVSVDLMDFRQQHMTTVLLLIIYLEKTYFWFKWNFIDCTCCQHHESFGESVLWKCNIFGGKPQITVNVYLLMCLIIKIWFPTLLSKDLDLRTDQSLESSWNSTEPLWVNVMVTDRNDGQIEPVNKLSFYLFISVKNKGTPSPYFFLLKWKWWQPLIRH